RVGAGDQLDEGHPRRACADHLREADLSQEPLPEENSAQARRLQARRDRQAGRAHAEARHLGEAVEVRQWLTAPSWPGAVPAIPVLGRCTVFKTWMPATSAGMTVER